MSDLPSELTVRSISLIGLFGLDISKPIHHSIWDAFNNNRRPDSAAVQFKLFNSNHEFPTVKPKRNSYEWYVPKGILKRNWMNKYLNEIPSVAVLFYDLDWHDALWNDKKMECVSRVQSLRAAIEGRNTKIAIVLIQKDTPPTSGNEDLVATERASALCAACELPAKTLYFLPYADHLLGYTFRLEHVFYELAQTFYHQEYKIIKNHREQLNKTVHQYLFVRHQFKMGFFNELKQDPNTANKHYQQAYNNLLDVRLVDTNSLEIKTIASFINYKICRLLFSLKLPKDAITQFRNHVERFKCQTGIKELMFEHHAWMSNQHSIFAELFDEAIRQGLPAVQTQHPGYYFQLAATHATRRQLSCEELCQNVILYPEPDPLAGEEKLEYYGQRPWRPGKLSAEPTDSNLETVAIQALQFKEKNSVNHSMIIISLLGNAISQFKIYRCPRMRRLLVVEMAQEYFKCKDYGKVLTLLMHMLWEYRNERWPVLLTDILKHALDAAYLSASVQDYLTLALESLGPLSTFPVEKKSKIYANIISILQKKPPNHELELPKNVSNSSVHDKWDHQIKRIEPFVFTIDDENITSFIDVKASFTLPKYTVNSTISIDVFVRNLYHQEVEFSKISVTITSISYLSEIVVFETKDSAYFQPNETKKFSYQFNAPEFDNSTEIQISTITIHFGSSSKSCLILRFSTTNRINNSIDRLYPEIQQLREKTFDRFCPLVSTKIFQEVSDVILTVESNGPVLLGEWFPIKVLITSNENISSAMLFLNLIQENNEQLTEFSLNMSDKQSSITKSIDKININENFEYLTYIRAHSVGDREFSVKFEYVRESEKKNSKEILFKLSIVKPFEVLTQFLTTLHEPLSKAFVNEPLFLMPHIKCLSQWPIEIIDTSIELGNHIIKETESEDKSILNKTVLNNGETGTDVFCIIPKASSEQPTSTGIYNIKWKRFNANEESNIVTSSSVTLAPLFVEDGVIGLRTKLPAHGWVRSPLCISYFIKNHSNYLITLKLTMESSDAFLFAGHKQVDICILPESEKKVEWILRPLIAGFVALPTLSLTVSPEEEYKLNKYKLGEIIERSIPSHIYIMPKTQNNEEINK